MTLSVTYNSELGFVESRLSGIVSPEELRQETIQAVALGRAHNCDFFLSDFSKADIDFSVLEVIALPELQDQEGLDRCAQIALVAPKSDHGRELAQFYERVCLNRSWSACTFEDRRAAVDWLIGP